MFKKTVKERAIKATKQKINQQITKVIRELNKKTSLYALWSLTGILLMILQPPKTIFVILSSVMILSALYLVSQSIKPLKTILHFINNFDREVKKGVEKEIKKHTEKSLKKKLGLWLSGQSHKDIEDLFISHSVRELVHRLKKHKWLILVRITAYTTAVLLFKKVLFYMFTN